MKSTINKKYDVNELFFENIDTKEKAYFLGLMMSDGSVSDYARNLSSIRNKELMTNNHPNKKPILCYDKNGLLIRKFESIRDGSKFYKISEHAICNNLIGRSKSCNNLIWKYA